MRKTLLRLSAALLLFMCHLVTWAQGGKEVCFGFSEAVTKTDGTTGTIGDFETTGTSELITTEWITDGLRSVATDGKPSWTNGGVTYTGSKSVLISFDPSPVQGYYGYKVTIPEGYTFTLKSVKADVLMIYQQLSQQVRVETAAGERVWESDSVYVRKGKWRNTISTTLTDNVELSAGTYLFKSVVSLTEGGGGKQHAPVSLMFYGELKYAGGSFFTNFKTIDGFSFTLSTGDGVTADLKDDNTYTSIRQSKLNPAFALKGSKAIYSDSRFKISAGQKYAIAVPANAVVSKVVFHSLSENYYDATTDNYALLDYFRSDGATCVYSDTIRGAKDTEFILQNHKYGSDIEFSVASCRQVAFSGITIEYAQYNDGQVNLLSSSINDKETTDASACLTLYFDRTVTLVDGAKMKLDGTEVRTVTNGSKVRAYYWNLPYGTTHKLTLAANSLKDVFDNCYDKDITLNFTVKEAPKTEKAVFDYVVGTPDELKAALTAVAESNKTADAARKRILVKNGDYDMGTDTQTNITGYHVSLVGQSREGVRIYHEGKGGIVGDATLCNKSVDFYMQDLTVEHASSVRKGNNRGVTVAYSGGNKAILKNVEMISGQDTYVTGDRTYHEDCIIHGTVDFICGGGDNYFYRTDLLIEGGACITAGSQDASTEWGYVFRDCTVKPGNFITPAATNGSYALGRPWKNEPRVAFIDTKMNITALDRGWNGMSMINTHFYEYGSKNASGKDINLSKRTVKDISLNQYTPVMTKEQADDYTMYNVVGGDDGWDPTLYTKQMEAPTVSAEGNVISWNDIENALCYVVFCNGKYAGQTTETSFTCVDKGIYTVCAANEMGGLGAVSAGNATDINQVNADKASQTEQVYDLSGRKQNGNKLGMGIYIVNGKKRIR